MRLRSAMTALALSAAVVLAGCNASDLLDHASEEPLPRDVRNIMEAKGMTKSSPIMMRIFKEEAELEVWKRTDTGRYELVKTYEICAYSGAKGPKFQEGDRQAPEGFYFVNYGLMNPNSSFHLSFNLGFPNAFDQSLGRTGSFLMVHGDCSSRGCYAMTDKYMTEIYAFARDALRGGQREFQVQAFPFRMTPENMAAHRDSTHFDYWSMLKSGYDHFELTRTPPKVDVCDRQYIFNMLPAEEGTEFVASQACPPKHMPVQIATAYTQLKMDHAVEFERAVAKLEGREFDPSRAVVDPTDLPPVLAPQATAPAQTAPAATPSQIAVPVATTTPQTPVTAVSGNTSGPIIATSSASGWATQNTGAATAPLPSGPLPTTRPAQ